ncbi:MAG: ABC transporter permease [Fusobacteriaceae bacterium]|jgi:peptide/nickel transport system permease protein|nr:ABC transporter permease [Fusobacteriaceae bacterium]
MLKYLLRRILQMVPVLVLISVIVFCFVNISGDPTATLLPPNATIEERQIMRDALGLNEPLYIQYGIFVKNVLHGDFGTSFRYKVPALRVVMEKIPASLELAGFSLLASVIFGITFGVLSAKAKNTPFDLVMNVLSALGRSMPNFWMGIMLILLLGVTWKILPVSGRGNWRYLILPCTSLAIQNASRIIPLVRSNMLEIMQQDYIRTAKSKGLKDNVVTFKHAFKNALVPVVTITALQIPTLIGGSLVTETVFSWPGLGQLVIQSIGSHDLTVVQACVFIIAVITMAANLLADLAYCLIDPRIRY